MNNYAYLLACRNSGQISDAQWQEHLQDEVFRAWLKKHEPALPIFGVGKIDDYFEWSKQYRAILDH